MNLTRIPITLILMGFFLAVAFPGVNQVEGREPSWFVDERDFALELPKRLVEESGNYTIVITREWDGKKELELLKKAEAVYPNKDEIVAEAKKKDSEWQIPLEDKDPLWWYSSFDGVRIPYAITARAVRYYLDLTQAFRRGDFIVSANIRMLKSQLKYTVAIQYHSNFVYEQQEFRGVYVATLELNWSQYCGNMCAMAFGKKRIVVLAPDGEVRAVFLDGSTPAEVS